MDYNTTTSSPNPSQKKSITDHATDALSGLKGWFTSPTPNNATPNNAQPVTVGGKKTKRKKSMKNKKSVKKGKKSKKCTKCNKNRKCLKCRKTKRKY